jgi:hypothetical protein
MLRAALSATAGRLRYTEFTMFEHMDPTKRQLPLLRLARELGKFYGALYPVFRATIAPRGGVPLEGPANPLPAS